MIFSFKNRVFLWAMRRRMRRIDFVNNNPREVQERWLHQLIATAKNTQWGKKHNYSSIKDYQKFKELVPISNYDEFSLEIQKVKNGDSNILWPTKSKWFAKSSGTSSSKSKFIPITQASLIDCHFKGGKDMLTLYCHNFPETQIYSGKSITMGGSFENTKKEGDLSAIILEQLPNWVTSHQTPNKEIRLMNDFEKKIELMAEVTAKENVTNISGVPSWTLILFQKILKNTGAKNMHEIWPNLEVYMHGGINFSPYKSQFEKMLPHGINYLEIYNASEGSFGIQDQKNSDEMLLMLDYGIFYEFIPAKSMSYKKAIPIWEVEKGINYAIVISTNAGLWRYLIGDTIVFTSTDPYRIKITGRTSQFINAFGEEVIMDNAIKALKHACKKSNASITDYTVAPLFMDNEKKGAHEWYIEFLNEPKEMKLFQDELDKELQKLNSDYEAKRYKNMALNPPIIKSLQKGFFYNWMKSNQKLGRQFKVPRLNNDRSIINSMFP